jgi:glycerate 2-kinase
MPLASDALAIARAGIAAVEPTVAIRRTLHREGRSIRIGRHRLRWEQGARIHLVAVGKAAAGMTDAAWRILGPDSVEGIAVVRQGDPRPDAPISIESGEHPIPGSRSLRAGATLLQYVERIEPPDLVLFLVSGGASAIAEIPAPKLSLGDIRVTYRALLRSGAPIGAVNVVRRHLSKIKGGRLAAATRSRGWATIAISDVPGDLPWDIGSGLTVPDPTTFRDAWDAVRQYDLTDRLPESVIRRLHAGPRNPSMETPKLGIDRLRRAPFVLAASNRTARKAAAREAARRGFTPWILKKDVLGEARVMGHIHGAMVREWARNRGPPQRPFCLLSGGETTVTLRGNSAAGGRNQEFALAASAPLAGLPRVLLLSIATDGVDGTTDAAGAWVNGNTQAKARRMGIEIRTALARHTTYPVLRRIAQLIRTGATGTNVMDLQIVLAGADPPPRKGR